MSTLQEIEAAVLRLSDKDRLQLADKLFGSLSGKTDPVVERAHLDEVRRRRETVRSGKAKLVDGDEALRRARAAMRK